jgi:hypothetical protein
MGLLNPGPLKLAVYEQLMAEVTYRTLFNRSVAQDTEVDPNMTRIWHPSKRLWLDVPVVSCADTQAILPGIPAQRTGPRPQPLPGKPKVVANSQSLAPAG